MQLQDSRRGARQAAYEIRVAASLEALAQERADVWDSGRVESDQSVNVTSTVVPPSSLAVAITGRCGFGTRRERLRPYSQASWWEMGLLFYVESEMDYPRHAALARRL